MYSGSSYRLISSSSRWFVAFASATRCANCRASSCCCIHDRNGEKITRNTVAATTNSVRIRPSAVVAEGCAATRLGSVRGEVGFAVRGEVRSR